MRKKLKFLLTNCRIFGIIHLLYVPLAQAAEHLPFKQGVPGSIPGWHTSRGRAAANPVSVLPEAGYFSASLSGVLIYLLYFTNYHENILFLTISGK